MKLRTSLTILAPVLLLATALGMFAAGSDYTLTRTTIDGGGIMFSSGGDLELSGTIGQPDAGTLSGGELALTGGFWFPVAPGDGDEDGAVDLVDFGVFNPCLLGPVDGLDTGCNRYDSDGSGHIDLRDFAAFQASFTGGS